MAAITEVGNRLLITRGKWRGWTAEIKEVKHLPYGLVDYVMEIDDSDENTVNKLGITVQSEDCSEYNPGNINLENRFDITNYLSVNEMRNVAKSVYDKKVNIYLDDIFNSRKNIGCGNIHQQVLTAIANKYVDEFVDKYREDFLNIFKKVINMDLPASNDEDEKCFGRAIQWRLEQIAGKYIEEHPDEIIEVMRDKIHESAKRMMDEKLSYSISRAIEKNIDTIIKDMFDVSDNK